MSARVFVVMGQTGEYSDWDQWPVAFYEDEDLARRLVEAAKGEALRLIACHKERWHIPGGANKYDPKMRVDSTGVQYIVVPVEAGPVIEPEDQA